MRGGKYSPFELNQKRASSVGAGIVLGFIVLTVWNWHLDQDITPGRGTIVSHNRFYANKGLNEPGRQALSEFTVSASELYDEVVHSCCMVIVEGIGRLVFDLGAPFSWSFDVRGT